MHIVFKEEYYEFLTGCLCTDVVTQVAKDIPRMKFFIDGTRVRSIEELYTHIQKTEHWQTTLKAVLPFLQQGVLAQAVNDFTSFLERRLCDGGRPMKVVLEILTGGFQLQITKVMKILDVCEEPEFIGKIKIEVLVSSSSDVVIITGSHC